MAKWTGLVLALYKMVSICGGTVYADAEGERTRSCLDGNQKYIAFLHLSMDDIVKEILTNSYKRYEADNPGFGPITDPADAADSLLRYVQSILDPLNEKLTVRKFQVEPVINKDDYDKPASSTSKTISCNAGRLPGTNNNVADHNSLNARAVMEMQTIRERENNHVGLQLILVACVGDYNGNAFEIVRHSTCDKVIMVMFREKDITAEIIKEAIVLALSDIGPSDAEQLGEDGLNAPSQMCSWGLKCLGIKKSTSGVLARSNIMRLDSDAYNDPSVQQVPMAAAA